MRKPPHKIIGFLLAAGHSKRFGSDKRLHRLPDGRTLMQASLDSISGICDEVLIAVRHDDFCKNGSANSAQLTLSDTLTLRGNQSVHRTSQSNAGMGESLATLANLLISRNLAETPLAVLVALADMPYIKPETMNVLKENVLLQFADAPRILAPAVDGKRGHPVIFSASLLEELALCSGDTGAKSVIENNLPYLTLIPVEDCGVLQDIDHPPAG